MLVLSRKEGERVLIGKDIRITVVRISPKTIRLGIEAPAGQSIVREEILLSDDSVPEEKILEKSPGSL